MFKIAMKQVSIIEAVDNKNSAIEEKYEITAEKPVILKVILENSMIYRLQNSNYLSRKYCTINDWCTYEMSANLAFNLYCVNANITPWEIIPKSKVKIPVYSFGINYIKKSILEQFSQDFQNKIFSERAKIGVIADSYFTNSLLENSVADEIAQYDLSNIDMILSRESEETIANYYRRFILHNNEAKGRGRYLEVMRLKTDVSFGNYADVYHVSQMEDDIYQDLTENSLASKFLSESTPSILTDRTSDLPCIESGNVIEAFSITEQPFSDIARWSDLADGTFAARAVCICSAGRLMAITPNDKFTIILEDLSKNEADQLVHQGIFYQLNANKYLIHTSAGYLSLEVK